MWSQAALAAMERLYLSCILPPPEAAQHLMVLTKGAHEALRRQQRVNRQLDRCDEQQLRRG